MENNDVLRRLRYALQLDDAEACRLAGLAGESVEVDAMAAFRLRSDAAAARSCPDRTLSALLAGLVIDRRGPSSSAEPGAPPLAPYVDENVDNNAVLKRVKTALSMRSEDIVACIEAGGGSVSASVVGSFLRRPNARNFRDMGDQMLRRFLEGLAATRRHAEPGQHD